MGCHYPFSALVAAALMMAIPGPGGASAQPYKGPPSDFTAYW
jgi:hypothetical protein